MTNEGIIKKREDKSYEKDSLIVKNNNINNEDNNNFDNFINNNLNQSGMSNLSLDSFIRKN